jgi:hypothetical protein
MDNDDFILLKIVISKLDEYNKICPKGHQFQLIYGQNGCIIRDIYGHRINSGLTSIREDLNLRIKNIEEENRVERFIPDVKALFEKTDLTKDGFLTLVKRSI